MIAEVRPKSNSELNFQRSEDHILHIMNCRVCFTENNDLFEIFGERGKNEKVADIIMIHFWFEIHANKNNIPVLCSECWLKISSFHEFYSEIKQKHSSINNELIQKVDQLEIVVKTENEGTFESVKIKEQQSSADENDEKNSINGDNLMGEIKPSKATRQAKPKLRKPKWPKKEQPITLDDKIENEKTYGGFPDHLIKGFCDLKCELCSKPYTKWAQMNKHYTQDHMIEGFITCCTKKFTKRSSFLQHLDKHIPESERKFKCEVCSKGFVKKYGLEAHQKSHMDKQNYEFECNDCGKLFGTKYGLSIHINGVHKGAFSRICEICAKVFKNKMIYLSHQRVFHSTTPQPAKIQCQKCGNWLKDANSLRKHQQRHREEENGPHICSICGKQAPNRNALKCHMKHSHVIERIHKCTICEKAFKRPLTLKEHMTTHTGEILYTCKFCTKTFNSSANMYSHRKKNHKMELEEAQKLAAR